MVSTSPLISKSSSSPFINLSDIVHQLQLVSPWPSCPKVFKQGLHIYLSFRFLLIWLSNLPGQQSLLFSRFSFFCWLSLVLVVWSKLGDPFESQNLEKFVCIILQERFWVVHIPLFRMVKFKFLAQFPTCHLLPPVVSSLIHFLRWFAAFVYHMIETPFNVSEYSSSFFSWHIHLIYVISGV